jgi:hypothetical protein
MVGLCKNLEIDEELNNWRVPVGDGRGIFGDELGLHDRIQGQGIDHVSRSFGEEDPEPSWIRH